jgi:hypothetical protein
VTDKQPRERKEGKMRDGAKSIQDEIADREAQIEELQEEIEELEEQREEECGDGDDSHHLPRLRHHQPTILVLPDRVFVSSALHAPDPFP